MVKLTHPTHSTHSLLSTQPSSQHKTSSSHNQLITYSTHHTTYGYVSHNLLITQLMLILFKVSIPANLVLIRTKRNLDYMTRPRKSFHSNPPIKSLRHTDPTIPAISVSDYIFYRPYRGEKPVFVNTHADAVMCGFG